MLSHFSSAIAALALSASALHAGSTYLAMGDSLGWGYGRFEGIPNAGDQGYVALYADHLATLNGGTRPELVNLSIPQESTASFFTGGQLGTLLNTNYPAVDPPTQHELMLDTITAQHAMGNTIDHVTVHLGVNDFLDLVDTGFLDLPEPQQNLAVLQVVEQILDNYTVILNDLAAMAPEADVRMLGYYNPYALFVDNPELDPSPDAVGVALSEVAGPIAGVINDVIEALAEAHDATFVPVSHLFDGNELELTRITTIDLGSPNIHPTDEGYAVIAQALIDAPAPGTAPLLAAIGAGLACRRRRHRA